MDAWRRRAHPSGLLDGLRAFVGVACVQDGSSRSGVCGAFQNRSVCCCSSFGVVDLTFAGAELFRDLPGGMPVCPGEEYEAVPTLAPSRAECMHSNSKLLQSLREDEHSAALHRLALDDCALGRMSVPVLVESVDLSEVSSLHSCVMAALPFCVCRGSARPSVRRCSRCQI